MNRKWLNIAGLGLTVVLLFIPVFINLGNLPIRLWDESRLAVSAYEMYLNGFSFITTFEGQPDLWSTKPPLLIWLQALMMHIVGPTETAVRLPSAFAVLFCALGLIYFSKKITGSYKTGFFAAIMLVTSNGFMVTSNGFIDYYSGRSGDYDALLVFWTTTASLVFFRANQQRFQIQRQNILFFVLLALGVLTKSIAALLFAPAYLILMAGSNNLKAFFRSKSVYVGIGLFVLMVGSFHIIREIMSSGYLEAVWYNDIYGRYSESLEGHKGPFTFYLENFINFEFDQYYLFALSGLILTFFRKRDSLNELMQFSAILFFTHLLIISSGETKLPWYSNPVFPFASILAGGFFTILINSISKIPSLTNSFRLFPQAFTILLFLLLFFKPLLSSIQHYYKPNEYEWDKNAYALSHYLQDALYENSAIDGYTIAFSEYSAHYYFYYLQLKNRGDNIGWKHIHQVEEGQKLIVGPGTDLEYLYANADVQVLWEKKDGIIKGLQVTNIHQQ